MCFQNSSQCNYQGIETGRLKEPFSSISSENLEKIRDMCSKTSFFDEEGNPHSVCLDIKNDWKAQQVWFMIGNFWFLSKEDKKAFHHYDFLEGINIAINPNTGKPVISPDMFYFNYGFTLETMGRHLDAIDSYQKVIAIDKDSYKSWYNISYSYDKLGDWQKALEASKKAVEIYPNYNHGWYGIGTAYLMLEQYEKAIEAFILTIAIDPSYFPAYSNLGMVLGKIKQYKREISVYDFALNIKPDDVNLWLNKAAALSNLKRYRAALHNINVAIEMDPTLFEVNYNKGIILLRMERPSEAVEFLRKAVKIQKTEIAIHDLAACYQQLGDHEKVKLTYEKLILFIHEKGKVEREKTLYSIISYSLDTKLNELYQEALQLLKKHFPKSGMFQNIKAVGLSSQGKLEEALSIYQDLILEDPNNDIYLTNMGETLIRLNRINEAIDILSKATKNNKKNTTAWNNLGAAYISINQLSKAMFCYEQALEIVPNDSDVIFNIGMIYLRNGKYNKALEYADQALTIKPNHYPYLQNKLVILNAIGDEIEISKFKEKYPDIKLAKDRYSTSVQ
jgi:tetratricopeptide (TPR) repeat protein